jgi:hypothetical protein
MDDAATPAAISVPLIQKPWLDVAGLHSEPNLNSEQSASTGVVSGERTFTTSEVFKFLQRLMIMPDLVSIMKISPSIFIIMVIIIVIIIIIIVIIY